jgi:hypothetical protein
MTLTEILPTLQQLSSQDKIKAIQFLATELERNGSREATLSEVERDSFKLDDGANYEIWSPYDAFSAEKALTDILERHRQIERQ